MIGNIILTTTTNYNNTTVEQQPSTPQPTTYVGGVCVCVGVCERATYKTTENKMISGTCKDLRKKKNIKCKLTWPHKDHRSSA